MGLHVYYPLNPKTLGLPNTYGTRLVRTKCIQHISQAISQTNNTATSSQSNTRRRPLQRRVAAWLYTKAKHKANVKVLLAFHLVLVIHDREFG